MINNTELFIKMVDCPDIQDMWKPKVGDWFYKNDGIGYGLWLIADIQEKGSIGSTEIIYYCSGDNMHQPYYDGNLIQFRCPENYIWLPRQDQLQEMARFEHDRHGGKQISAGDLMWKCTSWMVDELRENNWLLFGRPLFEWSMEQLLLAFVIKEKFNKTWNSEKWRIVNG